MAHGQQITYCVDPILTSFISINLPSSTVMMMVSVSLEGRNGTMENGGINSHTSAKVWRNLILGSASYLGLCLVADMLAHSPPLPLIIDYDSEIGDIGAEDEEGIAHALQQRDRVRRIRLWMPVLKLQKLLHQEKPTFLM